MLFNFLFILLDDSLYDSSLDHKLVELSLHCQIWSCHELLRHLLVNYCNHPSLLLYQWITALCSPNLTQILLRKRLSWLFRYLYNVNSSHGEIVNNRYVYLHCSTDSLDRLVIDPHLFLILIICQPLIWVFPYGVCIRILHSSSVLYAKGEILQL